MDELNILLSAKLNEKESIKNIARQIDIIQKQLKDINIGINLDDLKVGFNKLFSEFSKDMSKNKIYDSKGTNLEIKKTINNVKELEKELNELSSNGFKKGKTSTSFIDVGNGSQLKKIVEEYNDELNNSVRIVQNIDSKTGDLISIEKTLIDNAKSRVLEEEKLVNAMAKGRELSEARTATVNRKEEIAQAEAINKASDEEYNNQVKIEKQVREIAIAKKESESNIRSIVKTQDTYDKSEYDRLITTLNKIDPASKDAKLQMRELNAEIKQFKVTSQEASNTSNSFSDSVKRFTAFYGLYDVFNMGKQAISSMKDAVYDLNHAITELNKTSDITNIDGFISKAYDLSNTVSKTGSEVILATSEFSKAGFGESEEELLKFAKSALMLTNVGDGITDIAESSKSLIAAMRGFNTTDSQGILDLVNAVSNASGSNFEDISFALQRVSGTLGQMNVSVNSSVAAFSAVNEILQSAEVSSSGISSLFMRMRGLSEDTGEAVDGLIPTLEGLYNKIGITMVDENGQLRDTLSVLKDLSKVWDDLTINQKQMISQESAGIRQAKVFNTLVANFSRYEELLEVGLTSAGSAARENEVYLQSLAGMTQTLKSEIEALSNESISDEFIKSILSLTTNMVSLVRETGGLIPLLQTVLGIIITINAQATGKLFVDMGKHFSAIAISAKSLVQVFGNIVLGTQSLTGAFSALNISTATLATGGIGLLVAAIGGLSMHNNKIKSESEARIKETSALAQEYSSSAEALNSLKQEYDNILKTYESEEEIKSKLKEIQDKLVDTFGLEAKGIDLVNGKYSEQKDILNDLSNTKMQKAIREAKEDLGNTLSSQVLNTKGTMYFNNTLNPLSSSDKSKIAQIAEMVNAEFSDAIKLNFTDDMFGISSIGMDSYDLQAQDMFISLLKDTKLESRDVTNTFKDMYLENAKWVDNASIKQSTLNDLLFKQIELTSKSESGILSYDDTTEQQYEKFINSAYEQIDAMDETVQTKEELKDAIDNLAISAFPQFSDSLSESERTLYTLNKSLDELKSKSTSSSSDVELLNSSINSLNEGQTLTSDTILSLLEKFPSLRSEVTETNGVYSISEQALLDLKSQAVDTFGSMVTEQRETTNEAIANAKSRISAYLQELEQLKKLASAQTLMSAFDSNKTAMGYGDLTQDARGSKAIAEKEAQLKQEHINMQKYLDILNEINISEQDFNIATSLDNNKNSNSSNESGGDSNSSIANKLKDQIEKDKSAILKYGEDIQSTIERTKQKIELAGLKGDTKLSETLNVELETLYSQLPDANKKMAEELRILKANAIKEINSSALESDEKIELIEDMTVDFDTEIAQQSTDWWDSTNQLIEHQLYLLEQKKEILSEPLSDMELEISSHENKIKLLELENATMGAQVDAYTSLLESEALREEYLKLTIDDLYKQREVLDATSKQYKTLTEYILDFETQLTDSLQAQADAKEKLIDMTYKELEASLEKSIYGSDGQDMWEKLNDRKIDSLNDELDLLKEQADARQAQLDAEKRALEMVELRTQLENAKKQKTVQEFKKQADGSWQWEYVADAELVFDLEKQIRDKELEEEKRVEEEKQAKKEQALQDEIARLQKEAQAKSQFFTESKEDLLQYLQDNKDNLILNGEEVLGIIGSNMDNINTEFDTKMELISDSLKNKLAEIKAMFQDALSMESSMGGIGGGSSGSGKPTYSSTGGSGKTYFQYGDGVIEVLRPDGSSSTVKPSDKNYSSTVSAMEKDHVTKKYKDGGLITKTGLAWVDGELNNPERVLSAEQNRSFETLVDIIGRYDFSAIKSMSGFGNIPTANSMGNATVNNSNNVPIHIDKIEMHEVNNVEDMAKAIHSELPNAFSGLIAKSKLVSSGE